MPHDPRSRSSGRPNADRCSKKLLDAIEDDAKAGGCIIDWHACDLFPRSWVDLVVVLRAETSVLYDRLAERFVFLLSLIS